MAQEETHTEEIVTTHPEQVVRKVTRVETPQVRTEHPQKVFEKKKAIFRSYQVIWYILVLVEILLIFRITLKALGANPFAGFTNLIYVITNPLALPFQGILGTNVVEGSVFEWSTIIAAFVYFLLAWGIVSLFQLLKPVTPKEVENTVDP